MTPLPYHSMISYQPSSLIAQLHMNCLFEYKRCHLSDYVSASRASSCRTYIFMLLFSYATTGD